MKNAGTQRQSNAEQDEWTQIRRSLLYSPVAFPDRRRRDTLRALPGLRLTQADWRLLSLYFVFWRCGFGWTRRQRRRKLAQMREIIITQRSFQFERLTQSCGMVKRRLPAFTLTTQVRAASRFFSGRVGDYAVLHGSDNPRQLALAAHGAANNARSLGNMFHCH